MATYDYSEDVADVIAMLNEFGLAGSLQRPKTGTSLQADGSAGGSTPAPETVQMIQLTGATKAGIAGLLAAMADNLRSFDATHLMAPLSVEPPVGSSFTYDGKTLKVKAVKTVRPAGVNLIHFIDAGRP